MPTPLESAIVETIAYFDLFSYPLTVLEIWQNLSKKVSYAAVYSLLTESAWLKGRLSHGNGMWYLKKGNTSQIIIGRQERYCASVQKLKKALQFARFLRFVPWIQAAYVCNSLGYLNTKPDKDIDLFILTSRGRIWISRLCLILLAELCGFRPKGEHVRDGLCLSFFASENADLESLALPERDIYYMYWLSKLMPIFARGGALAQYWHRREMLHRNLPQLQMSMMPSSLWRSLSSFRTAPFALGDRLEKFAEKLQRAIMPPYLKDVANQGTSVVVNNEVLKFHDHDRRAYFQDAFSKRVSSVLS